MGQFESARFELKKLTEDLFEVGHTTCWRCVTAVGEEVDEHLANVVLFGAFQQTEQVLDVGVYTAITRSENEKVSMTLFDSFQRERAF